MPAQVKLCYGSLRKNAPDYMIIELITLNNYKDFVDIPQYIEELFLSKKISMAFYSDYLRSALLQNYGGWWIDATFYITENFFCSNKANTWWSVKLIDEQLCKLNNLSTTITQGKWCGSVQWGTSGNIVNSFLKESYDLYFQTYDSILHYYFQDLFIRVGYENIPGIKKVIDSIEYSNPDLFNASKYWNMEYDDTAWNNMKSDTHIFRMSYKTPIFLKTQNGNATLIGKLSEIDK